MLNINYFIPEIPFVLRKSYKIYVDEKKNIIFIYNTSIYFVYVFTDLKTFHRLLTGPILFWVMITVWQNVWHFVTKVDISGRLNKLPGAKDWTGYGGQWRVNSIDNKVFIHLHVLFNGYATFVGPGSFRNHCWYYFNRFLSVPTDYIITSTIFSFFDLYKELLKKINYEDWMILN